MTDTTTTKHSPTKANNVIPDKKSSFSALRTRRTMAFGYGFTFTFVLCSVILVLNSSANSSPWFRNVFNTSSPSYRSHFSSIFYHFFPQTPHSPPPSYPLENTHNFSSPPNTTFQFSREKVGVSNNNKDTSSQYSGKKDGVLNHDKITTSQFSGKKEGVLVDNKNTTSQVSGKKEGVLDDHKNTTCQISGKNEGVSNESKPTPSQFSGKKGVPNDNKNQTSQFSGKNDNHTVNSNSSSQVKDGFREGGNGKQGAPMSNDTAFLMHRKGSSGSRSGGSKAKQSKEKWFQLMNNCDIFDGKWVRDDSYPLYEAGSCPHIDEPFNCFLNGRPDADYQKYRWQPKNCNIPRLNGRDMLELLRGKRLVFVGDSLNRNMWESLVCILRNSVNDKSRVFEASGRHEFRTEGSYSFVFKDYSCSVEFFRSPFLVQEWEMPGTDGSKKETLRLDIIERSSDRYKTADVLIFNTGHWWTHEKTSKGKGYYQEGSHVYGQLNVAEAFRKAMTTWARWVDVNINPLRTLVFFRGYSASHFR